MAGACDYNPDLIKRVPEGAILAPFVRVTISASGSVITVGNESSPQTGPPHTAVIRDFELGHSNGVEARMTVHDEQGGSFVKFMENLLKDYKCTFPSQGWEAQVQFGWIASGCDGDIQLPPSPVYYLQMREVNCTEADGKFLFEVGMFDSMQASFDGRSFNVLGGDALKDAMYLTDAITKLLTDPKFPPTVSSVKFLRLVPNGGGQARTERVKFRDVTDDPYKGPKAKWSCNGLSKLEVCNAWLKQHLTDKNKALLPAFNAQARGGEVIFWEDFKPGCSEFKDWNGSSLGTYIVKGGQHSPVLQFSPKIKWNFGSILGSGGNIDIKPGKGDSFDGPDDCPELVVQRIGRAGVAMAATPNEVTESVFGFDKQHLLEESQRKHARAMLPLTLNYTAPIEADLVCVGDPTISTLPNLGLYRNLHIVYLNSHFIVGSNATGGSCGDWLAMPSCNQVLSNKNWNVLNIVHRISGGKYTTTFHVMLTPPGVELGSSAPLGGAGSGGWTPPRNC